MYSVSLKTSLALGATGELDLVEVSANDRQVPSPQPEHTYVNYLRLVDPQPDNGSVLTNPSRVQLLVGREELNLPTYSIVDAAELQRHILLMSEHPYEISHRVVRQGEALILVISFRSTRTYIQHRLGGESREIASLLASGFEKIVEDVNPELVVLDATQFTHLLGKFLSWLTKPLQGVAWCCVPPPEPDGIGFRSWFLSDYLFETAEVAISELARRRMAGKFSIHEGAKVVEEYAWLTRGYRHVAHEDDGRSCETLWCQRRIIERLGRAPDGEVEWHVMWPNIDGEDVPNQACTLGARIVLEHGVIKTLDFSPGQTGRPLRREWVEALDECKEVRELSLYGADVADADIVEALARAPHLEELDVRQTKVTDKLLQQLVSGAGPALQRISVDGLGVSAEMVLAVETARPELDVIHDS